MVFWRNNISIKERKLLLMVCKAHEESAKRNNISSVTITNAFAGSKSYTKALASGLLTLGGVHAPLEQTYAFLEAYSSDPTIVDDMLFNNTLVPGWGNGFIKGKPDPQWVEVDEYIKKEWRDLGIALDDITKTLHEAGKKIYPNPSCYTAATALILGIPKEMTAWIFVKGRLDAWSDIMYNYLNRR